MTMLVHKWSTTAAVAGGAWSGNTEKLSGVQCMQVYIKAPAPAVDVFDFIIYDPYGTPIREFLSVPGTYCDVTPFLMAGIHTLTITNATADGNYTIAMGFWER